MLVDLEVWGETRTEELNVLEEEADGASGVRPDLAFVSASVANSGGTGELCQLLRRIVSTCIFLLLINSIRVLYAGEDLGVLGDHPSKHENAPFEDQHPRVKVRAIRAIGKHELKALDT